MTHFQRKAYKNGNSLLPMKCKKAIVCTPNERYAEGITPDEVRKKLGKPDYQKALAQHKAYCDALRQAGVTEIIDLAAYREEWSRLPCWRDYIPVHFSPDDCFVEDLAVVTEQGVILTNPGHPQRRGEVFFMDYVLNDCLKYSLIGSIQSPGYLDGGDVVRVGNHYFLGYSDRETDIRTNTEGLRQLEKILTEKGYTFSRIPVRKPLHLSTGSSCLDNRTVVTISEFFDYYSNHVARDRINMLLPARSEEYATNMRSVNGHVLMPAGFPSMKMMVRDLDYKLKIIEVELSEFQKQNGSTTCLSLLVPETLKSSG